MVQDVDDEMEVEGQDVADDEEGAETSVVPDLLATETELEGLRKQIQPERHHLTMPSLRATPLSEFNKTQAMLSWAFPSLFPKGDAEIVIPRMRSVSYVDYVRHLLKYHDGRFAKHPRFRYVVFNTIMRKQVNTRASFFVKRPANVDRAEMTLDDLRAAFETDSEEAQALINSITRFSGSL
jgi:hypothetical protein